MSISEHQWSEILKGAFSQRDSSNVKTMAQAAVHSWEKLTMGLIPLLGPCSVYLIYRRSLDLNKSFFHWLPVATKGDTVQDAIVELGRALELQNGDDVARANLALSRTFAELLTALIGDRLTTLFVRAAFPDQGIPMSSKENCK